jgi:hypothetical protein
MIVVEDTPIPQEEPSGRAYFEIAEGRHTVLEWHLGSCVWLAIARRDTIMRGIALPKRSQPSSSCF